MKAHTILLILFLLSISTSKAVNLEDASATGDYETTTTINTGIKNPRDNGEENLGAKIGDVNSNNNLGVVIPLERIIAGLEALENLGKSEETDQEIDESQFVYNKFNRSQYNHGGIFNQSHFSTNLSDQSNFSRDKFDQLQRPSNAFPQTQPKYTMFENFPIVNKPDSKGALLPEQNLVKTDEEPSKPEHNKQIIKVKQQEEFSKLSSKKETQSPHNYQNQFKEASTVTPLQEKEADRGNTLQEKGVSRTTFQQEKEFSRVTFKQQEKYVSEEKPQQERNISGVDSLHEELSRVNPPKEKVLSRTNYQQVLGLSRVSPLIEEKKFSRVNPPHHQKEFSKRRRRPTSQVQARRKVYNNHKNKAQPPKTTQENERHKGSETTSGSNHNNGGGSNLEINQHHQRDTNPTPRRGRLRISAPTSQISQHDILGPHIFNIDPDLSEDEIISHLLSTSGSQEHSSEHRGRGKISELAGVDNAEQTDVNGDEASGTEPSSQSIFHPYSQNSRSHNISNKRRGIYTILCLIIKLRNKHRNL